MDEVQKTELETIWKLIYQSIKESRELADEALTLWFSDMGLKELTEEKATFTVATEFRYKTVVNRYYDIVSKHLSLVVGYTPEVEIIFDPSGYVPPKLEGEGEVISPLELADINIAKKKALEEAKGAKEESEGKLGESEEEPDFQATSATGKEKLTFNPDFTFDNFVVGSSNNLAYAAARNVAENPATEYNPFFLYGPSGVGKTHLMYAITNKVLELYPNMNIVFVKGEEFANQLIECLSHKYGGKTFRDKYRTVDMLLIDDIHFIAGREAIQEEFFHTFNALFEGHKQIIVSSDKPPSEMHTLETRIRTRFESGLLADVKSPDYDLRLAIVRRKALNTGIRLDTEVEKYLAEKLGSSIRQIEGIIKKISARYYLTGEAPTIDSIKILVPEFMKERDLPRVVAHKAISVAAAHFGCTDEDIIGQKRDKNIRMARNGAMLIVKNETDLSLAEIGRVFNRNYSTVINNCNAAKAMMDADPSYAAELKEIEKESKI